MEKQIESTIKLVILDRDGVINYDSDAYIKSPQEWEPIPGSLEAIAALKNAGWTVAVATNQSGLARGYFDIEALASIHDKMNVALSKHNAAIDFLAWCPHAPEANCNCRKPKPGLYLRIASYYRCSLIDVPVIGDSLRDLEAAHLVRANPILVKTGKGIQYVDSSDLPPGTKIFDDLQSSVAALLARR